MKRCEFWLDVNDIHGWLQNRQSGLRFISIFAQLSVLIKNGVSGESFPVLYIICMWVSEKNSLHGIHFRNQRTLGHPAYRPDVRSDYHLFIAPKQNPGGHTFKDDRELETVMIFSLVTRDRD
jgi:hypothetical protein